MGDKIGDTLYSISAASAKVSSVAARGVLEAIKVRGTTATPRTPHVVAEFLTFHINWALQIVELHERRAREAANSTLDYRLTGQPAIMDLEAVVDNILGWADLNYFSIRKTLGEINSGEGRYAQIRPQVKEFEISVLHTLAEIVRIMENVIETCIAYAPRTSHSVPSVEDLARAIHDAVKVAAFAVAETAVLAKEEAPPPYEQ